MRYAFIQESLSDNELKGIPISLRCQILDVSVSGYHSWVKRQTTPKRKKKIVSPETLLGQAKIIRNEMGYTPGYRQMHVLMQRRGVKVSVKRLRDVLRLNGIIGYRFFKRSVKTTDSNHTMP
ncbi:integrase catalytic subunit, partial [gut metagenome]